MATRPARRRQDERLLLPLKEAAPLLSMGYSRALYYVQTGQLRSVRNGSRYLISRREIEAFIERAEAGNPRDDRTDREAS